MIERFKIPVQRLRSGMFVAELDRPWLDTPFLFQGFLIRSEREVEELCRYCKWVFVDSARSDADMDALRTASGGKGLSLRQRALALLGMNGATDSGSMDRLESLSVLDRRPYPEQKVSMCDELPHAEASVAKAQELVQQALHQLRVTETIEMSLVAEAVDPIIDSVLRNKNAMVLLQSMRGKDDYTYSRSVACAVWAVIFGRHLGLDKETLTLLSIGSLLLDLGKIKLPDELLTRIGPLAAKEMELVRKHVDYGAKMLERSGGFDSRIIEMVRTHHERFNGTGYPDGLKATAIPALGKIAGILDTFVAMTSQRPHADAMATYDVMRHLNEMADVEFQAELVEQFVQAIGMFPTGSLVELSTGEVAIVTEQNRIQRLRPKVMVVLGQDKTLLEDFNQLDLRIQTTDSSGEYSLWIQRGLPPGSYGIDPAEYFL